MLKFLGYIVTFVSKNILGKKPQTADTSVKLVTGKQDSPEKEDIALISMKKGSDRLNDEFTKYIVDEGNNQALKDLIIDVSKYTMDNFGKGIVITMIYRTKEEQDDIYAGTERRGRKYDEKPWKSPHQFYHAVDLRSRSFTPQEINQLVDYINAKYNQDNYYKFTAKCHNVGRGDHFHIQFVKP